MAETIYDCIVIGGGPSGLMAAVSAASRGAKTLLIDKGNKLGRKLAISGGGRCNVTNAGSLEEIIKNIPGNGRFLYSALHNFSNKDIIAFFEGLGIRLKEEDRGRMFPVSDKAKTVVDALVGKVRDLGTEIRTNTPVDRVLYQDGRVDGVVLKDGERIRSRTVIIATGGKSVPQTGSTGDGYAWAVEAGHTITELYPTEVPITSSEPFIQQKTLQGISLRDIELTIWDPKGRKIISHEGDMIFTHFGISGPAALRCSQFVVKAKKKFQQEQIWMSLNLFPDRSTEALAEQIRNIRLDEPKKSAKNALHALMPERLLVFLLQRAGMAEDKPMHQMSNAELQTFAMLCRRFDFWVSGTRPLEEAFVTGGGVRLKEIDPKTCGSKLMKGLFFCGEILDIHGYTGGYNITAAFATGYTAGMAAAAYRSNTHP